MNSPNFKVHFFCVGAAKAGTTSLHDLLALQENVSLPQRKETNFFSIGIHGRPEFSGPLDKTSINDTTVTSFADYENDFENSAASLNGEICPSYALPGTAKNIHSHNPDAKIIILLRDPVSRAFSNYQHLVRDGRETLPFEQALAAEDHRLASGWEWFWGLKRNSLYCAVVKEYLELFGKQQVKIVIFEDFISNQKSELQAIAEFIGLDSDSIRFEDIFSNKSGVVSARWKLIHQLVLAEGPVNRNLRKLLPLGLRKYLGGLFKKLTTTKGQLNQETEVALRREFAEDLEALSLIANDIKAPWLGGSDVP